MKLMIMEICKVLNKHAHIMYIKMENVIKKKRKEKKRKDIDKGSSITMQKMHRHTHTRTHTHTHYRLVGLGSEGQCGLNEI